MLSLLVLIYWDSWVPLFEVDDATMALHWTCPDYLFISLSWILSHRPQWVVTHHVISIIGSQVFANRLFTCHYLETRCLASFNFIFDCLAGFNCIFNRHWEHFYLFLNESAFNGFYVHLTGFSILLGFLFPPSTARVRILISFLMDKISK